MGNVANKSTIVQTLNKDNISTFLDENNKTEKANVDKIISDNNESNKSTFLQILEDNNNKIKLDIMERIKKTNLFSIKSTQKWKLCSLNSKPT